MSRFFTRHCDAYDAEPPERPSGDEYSDDSGPRLRENRCACGMLALSCRLVTGLHPERCEHRDAGERAA